MARKYNFVVANTQLIIESVLCNDIKTRRDTDALKAFCNECDSREYGVKKSILKLQRQETNRLMVNAVIKSLDEEQQRFIDMYYIKRFKPETIINMLYISKAQMNLWHNKIVNEVAEALRFRLCGNSDIFNLKKIINMREALVELILLIKSIDGDLQIVNKYWFRGVISRYSKYSAYMVHAKNYIQSDDDSLHVRIIVYKLKNPHAELQAIADAIHVDISTVSRHFAAYKEEVKEYIN